MSIAPQQTGSYLGLLVEDGLGLTTKTRLLAVITTLALCVEGILALLVLRHLPFPVGLAVVAIGLHLLGEVHHLRTAKSKTRTQFGVC